jgi:hypothetical protein
MAGSANASRMTGATAAGAPATNKASALMSSVFTVYVLSSQWLGNQLAAYPPQAGGAS